MPCVLSISHVRQHRSSQIAPTKRVIEFAITEKTGIRWDVAPRFSSSSRRSNLTRTGHLPVSTIGYNIWLQISGGQKASRVNQGMGLGDSGRFLMFGKFKQILFLVTLLLLASSAVAVAQGNGNGHGNGDSDRDRDRGRAQSEPQDQSADEPD